LVLRHQQDLLQRSLPKSSSNILWRTDSTCQTDKQGRQTRKPKKLLT
jgi:hypothetical protein